MSDFGSVRLFLKDEAATVKAGTQLAVALNTGAVIYLEGDLGAGKTTFTRGVLRACGYQGSVKSPTYTLCEPYELSDDRQLCHFDLYRLSNPEELEFLGIRDYIASNAILFIEWPSRGEGWLPPADLSVSLSESGEGRELTMVALTARGGVMAAQFGEQSV
ncbi:MAG: tRNA (adenosine(37)-N6)-threonylcarbamoyltransferase complex ATPase subunit type 1 TsaE [Luminiphilus sp.]|jgi:tRNA threonylcarbamoyladenosine biosynthesis protein TsaE|nr:tRNA (adenosine(37)-N6)-threonylcarbamoyltransferase complex ATPase subunit type 1 TsaE [Pseudomonadales bacterium]MBL6823235.1 tRNA (adenosine(37)-N6)-threonylcarbamoyltransferase complex ATPase subunit type 1 TsaE [Luminiphilus sp.]MBL6900756.1 tRNA (adenosine(37)-N6)-threonylcarbamoyltransferase complex ATPase subunit type 1 TsaE [Luminiphilus sp.]MDA0891706.1 tRNA (adenosine(37)-N6)-threonylcarbamoyltransferase complex ATPase subunit type 1 TsaE [Pseudomonadota bacterium]